MATFRIDNGKTFDAFQWTGERDCLAPWAAEFESEERRFYGMVLVVGPYFVKVGSWVLRGYERGDIFPVPGDMFHKIYTEVTDGQNDSE